MFTTKEKEVIRSIPNFFIDLDNPTDDQLVELETQIADLLVLRELDDNYNPSEKGKIFEDILDKLSKIN